MSECSDMCVKFQTSTIRCGGLSTHDDAGQRHMMGNSWLHRLFGIYTKCIYAFMPKGEVKDYSFLVIKTHGMFYDRTRQTFDTLGMLSILLGKVVLRCWAQSRLSSTKVDFYQDKAVEGLTFVRLPSVYLTVWFAHLPHLSTTKKNKWRFRLLTGLTEQVSTFF